MTQPTARDFIGTPLHIGDLAVWGDFEGCTLVRITAIREADWQAGQDGNIGINLVRKINGETDPLLRWLAPHQLALYSDRYRDMHPDHIAALFNLDYTQPIPQVKNND